MCVYEPQCVYGFVGDKLNWNKWLNKLIEVFMKS